MRIVLITQAGTMKPPVIPRAPIVLPSPAQAALSRISSEALLGVFGQVEIAHKGEIYRLTVTRQGKLILTK